MYIVWEISRVDDLWEVRKGNKVIDKGSYEYCVDIRKSLNGSIENEIWIDINNVGSISR